MQAINSLHSLSCASLRSIDDRRSSASTVSRDELYEQVWSRPVTRVAADYGVTSTALKKTCKRHKIPTPKRGYWATLEHRKPAPKTTLPKLNDTRLEAMKKRSGRSKTPRPQGRPIGRLRGLRDKIVTATREL
ncbi:hypothetical protein QA639_12840 [Bradyrhizobium pachyrhizi]|uniref:hypothetical protein n=1 Tax=Bradyrhizobium pachyrhizi TaxID=280333 RepID=UPI0024B14AE2|nr:hypothetical protein [Bradyrhizobium pachyrhizi]WFU58327.1 hypothetical protein QA639_12840 [Bradyrhizobium pachyrhizi]